MFSTVSTLLFLFLFFAYLMNLTLSRCRTESTSEQPEPEKKLDEPNEISVPTITTNGDKEIDPEAVWSTPELVDAILEENFKLRQQVQNHQDHIAKLQKFEQELSAVQAAHQALVRSSERKESLERSARLRLETEWRRSQDMNAVLRNQIELLTSQLTLRSPSVTSLSADSSSSTDWQNQISRRDALIAQLVSQSIIRYFVMFAFCYHHSLNSYVYNFR